MDHVIGADDLDFNRAIFRLQLDAGRFDEAEAAYGDALALAQALGMRPRVAVAHLGLGRLHQRAGRRAEATAHLAAAIRLFEEMEMPFWLTQAAVALDRGGER